MIGFLVLLVVVAISLVIAGIVAQALGSYRDARRFRPPGELVDIGGFRLHVDSGGDRDPTVVFDSALGGSGISWCRVAPRVAAFARAVTYDRGGHGFSDPGPRPRTAAQLVEELRSALGAARLEPPFVLVGHSFGGLVSRLFAARYPDEVAGLVLVDPADPIDLLENPLQRRRIEGGAWLARRGALAARLGLARVVAFLATHGAQAAARTTVFLVSRGILESGGVRLLAPVARVPQELHPVLRSFFVQPKFFDALAAQLEALPVSAAQVSAVSDLGDLPITILSATNTEALNRKVLDLSTDSELRVVSDSGHWIPLEHPEVVVDAVRALMDRVKANPRRASRSAPS